MPHGGAPKGMATDVAAWDAAFAELLSIWKRPHGDEDEDAAWPVFVIACCSCQRDPDDLATEIIASARRWVAAYQHKSDKLKPLWTWLSLNTWKNQPPPPKPTRNGGKVSLAETMRKLGEQS
jgi:hypothetical protein